MANQDHQLVTRGLVIGFVDGQPDLVRINDGFYNIVAYVPGARNQVTVGQQYSLYKQNGLYHLGVEVNH
jgi:hypothetical protein